MTEHDKRERPLTPTLHGAAARVGKHPGMIVRQAEPFNAGPPLKLLCQSLVTPTELFFVRSHGAIPRVHAADYRLEISRANQAPVRLSLADLQDSFPQVTVPATLQCAGNRRDELMVARPIAGELAWGADALSHAQWSGVRLGDVLLRAGLDPDPGSRRHVVFVGLDETDRLGRRINFGGSIPLAKALGPEVILAHTMNGRPLLPAHGFPLRVVVPGYIGARSVKWLQRIAVREQPSTNYFQSRAYKLFPPQVSAADVIWEAGLMLGETSLNSVICSPAENERLPASHVTVQGYVVGDARHPVVRVDVSANGGLTWAEAELTGAAQPWTWRLWQVCIHLEPGRHALVVRAVDAAGNTQPSDPLQVWNFKGYMNNAWHRVNLEICP